MGEKSLEDKSAIAVLISAILSFIILLGLALMGENYSETGLCEFEGQKIANTKCITEHNTMEDYYWLCLIPVLMVGIISIIVMGLDKDDEDY